MNGPLRIDDALSLDDARRAAHQLALSRREAENVHELAVERAAATERDYRKALAGAIVSAEGTAAAREAVARSEVAHLSYERDLSAGMVKVAQERLRGLEGERSMLKSLIEFSMRTLSESGATQPSWSDRRAA